jgi:hypothetical protein
MAAQSAEYSFLTIASNRLYPRLSFMSAPSENLCKSLHLLPCLSMIKHIAIINHSAANLLSIFYYFFFSLLFLRLPSSYK